MLDETNQTEREIEEVESLEESPVQEPTQDLPEEPIPEEGAPTEDVLDAPEAEVPEAPAEPPRVKEYKTKTKIAAFFFLAVTLLVFIAYEVFCATYLYSPFANSPNDIKEAIAAIFGYFFGFLITLIFGLVQLPENIISIILFKRLRGKSDKKWENILFTVGYALSIVTLLITLLSFALFIAIIILF